MWGTWELSELTAWFFYLKLSLFFLIIKRTEIAPTFLHLNLQDDLIWKRFPFPVRFIYCNSNFVWKVQNTDSKIIATEIIQFVIDAKTE